jgi:hypothetical protein
VARDAHAAAITSTVDAALEEAGVTPQQLTAVAVTVGPGLSLCLQVGCVWGWVPVQQGEGACIYTQCCMRRVVEKQVAANGHSMFVQAAALTPS